jgi:hypothetical protein
MATRGLMTISISGELREKMNSIPNKSGLIECLLIDYFKLNTKDINVLKEKKEELEKEIHNTIEIKQKEVDKISLILDKQAKSEAEKEAEKILALEEEEKEAELERQRIISLVDSENDLSIKVYNGDTSIEMVKEYRARGHNEMDMITLIKYNEMLRNQNDTEWEKQAIQN